MKTFKTPMGSILPLMDLKGKDYLQVQHRVVWFREENPTFSIETQMSEMRAEYVIFKARVLDANSKVMATAHKMAFTGSSKNPLEMAETGAIGRALALCGYGTAFCDDFEEEAEEPADAPLPARSSHNTTNPNITFHPGFGKGGSR